MTVEESENSDTLMIEDDKKSSARVLAAIKEAERAFNDWNGYCDTIDEIYARGEVRGDWADPDYDLWWSSTEVLKPAIYAKPPVPVVSPQFKDRRKLQNTAAELLERSVVSAFDRAGLDLEMICTRDDLIFYNRGQLWVTYESDDGQKVCIEHLDRKDFLHPPARKWSDVPWVARRAWMTREQMKARFEKTSGDAYEHINLGSRDRSSQYSTETDHANQAGVWEVWHKADNRVYWCVEGCDVLLDEGEPHLKLRGFFPCPRPAYGTLRPRSLEPVPDYKRYAGHFNKINELTKRIYGLLDEIRMKGLIPSGGDVASAVQKLLKEADSSTGMMLIEVPGAALMASGGSGNFVQWLPLDMIATTITGLIQARAELFADFDRLSGISDIMRGETQADETLGAQRLKGQYGSARIKEKVNELQRIARDVTEIAAEIMAEQFSSDTLLEMSQLEIPTKKDIEKTIKKLEDDAKADLKELDKKAKEDLQKAEQKLMQAQQQGQQIDPKQVEQQKQQAAAQFQKMQQEIIAKYAPMIKQASDSVPLEDIMKLLRDNKARGFAFEIATDSTIMTDELAEKQSRNELLGVFTQAAASLQTLGALGAGGAKLAGEMLKFVLQPYRVGRELNSVIDDFVEGLPQAAAQMAGQGDQNSEAQKMLAEANNKIADAELQKAQASIAKVQADTQKTQMDMELRTKEAQAKAQADASRIGLELEQTRGSIAETNARIEKIMAEIQKLGVDASNQTRSQDREDIKAVADIRSRQVDQAMSAQDRQRAAVESEHSRMMGERQQSFSERQAEQQNMERDDD